MAPNGNGSKQPPTPQKSSEKKSRGKGERRYVLSARAQAALVWILEEIIDKTLSDAKQLAEAAGKQRVELAEVEKALKMLVERYHARWSSPATPAAAPSSSSASSKKSPSENRRKS